MNVKAIHVEVVLRKGTKSGGVKRENRKVQAAASVYWVAQRFGDSITWDLPRRVNTHVSKLFTWEIRKALSQTLCSTVPGSIISPTLSGCMCLSAKAVPMESSTLTSESHKTEEERIQCPTEARIYTKVVNTLLGLFSAVVAGGEGGWKEYEVTHKWCPLMVDSFQPVRSCHLY